MMWEGNNLYVTLSLASLTASAYHMGLGTLVCLLMPVWCVRVCVCVCLSILESSAGVGDGDDGGAQSEQGGQEMGNQSG